MLLPVTKIESLPANVFLFVQNGYMNGRNKRKKDLSTLCYGKESWFKRSLVSPLCSFIVTSFLKNIRWDTVQMQQKLIVQREENGRFD